MTRAIETRSFVSGDGDKFFSSCCAPSVSAGARGRRARDTPPGQVLRDSKKREKRPARVKNTRGGPAPAQRLPGRRVHVPPLHSTGFRKPKGWRLSSGAVFKEIEPNLFGHVLAVSSATRHHLPGSTVRETGAFLRWQLERERFGITSFILARRDNEW